MKVNSVIVGFVILLLVNVERTLGSNEITSILNEANDLNSEEILILRPIFAELQEIYDHVRKEVIKIAPTAKDIPEEIYINTAVILEENFANLNLKLEEETQQFPLVLNETLPKIDDLFEMPTALASMSIDDANMVLDMKDILEETLGDVGTAINKLLKLRSDVVGGLIRIRINKPKIVMFVLRALGVLFKIASRVSRAAYCTYSYSPQLKAALENITEATECYSYTKKLIAKVEKETVETVTVLRKDIFDLARIYKKVAAKRTIVGKITSTILSVVSIARDISEVLTTSENAINDVRDKLPDAARKSQECGQDFVNNVPNILQPIKDLKTCILFVDTTEIEYDFMKPENERLMLK